MPLAAFLLRLEDRHGRAISRAFLAQTPSSVGPRPRRFSRSVVSRSLRRGRSREPGLRPALQLLAPDLRVVARVDREARMEQEVLDRAGPRDAAGGELCRARPQAREELVLAAGALDDQHRTLGAARAHA